VEGVVRRFGWDPFFLIGRFNFKEFFVFFLKKPAANVADFARKSACKPHTLSVVASLAIDGLIAAHVALRDRVCISSWFS